MACARDQTPSLSKRWDKWFRTVFSLMPSRSAISELLNPSASSNRVSRSRRDSSPNAWSDTAARRLAGEFEHRIREARPRRFVREQDVIARFELDELRAGNFRRERTPFADRHHCVLAAVQDQRRRLDVWEERRHIRDARARRMVGAISGETVFKHKSLNHCCCSLVPSGMNRDVKTCRNAGLSLPHILARSMMAAFI